MRKEKLAVKNTLKHLILPSIKIMDPVWKTATALRGHIEPHRYKDIFFSLEFYWYISKKINSIAAGLGEDYLVQWKNPKKKAVLLRRFSAIGYYVLPEDLFSAVLKKVEDNSLTTEDLENIFLRIISSAFDDKIRNILTIIFRVDLQDLENEVLCDVIKAVNETCFVDSGDFIAKQYMQLLNLFESSAGKKSGEFYTPHCLCILVCNIVSLFFDRIQSLSDPCLGSGSMLLEITSRMSVEQLYGCDTNAASHRLALINTLIHDLDYRKVNYKIGDTLLDNEREIYQVQVTNPPFSLEWNPQKTEKYPIPAPKSRADYAFVQHVVYHMGELAVILLPSGVLYRKGKEAQIRKWLLRKKLIHTVIVLPKNLFMNTAIEVCCLVLKPNSENVQMIDASNLYSKQKNRNIMKTQHIDEILKRIQKRITDGAYSDDISQVIKASEISDGFLFWKAVSQSSEEEEIDIKGLLHQKKILKAKIEKYDYIIEKELKKIGKHNTSW